MCHAMINRCTLCNRRLKDPLSISRGIGSTCFKKLNPAKSRRIRRPKVKEKVVTDDENQGVFDFNRVWSGC